MNLSVERIVPPLAALAVAFAFAGCAGGSQMTPAGVANGSPIGDAPMTAAQQPLSNELQVPDACEHGGGGVKLRPCHIVFNSNHPGPVTEQVRSHGRAVSETDNCASRGVATVAKSRDFIYKVTAGATSGRCSARFAVPGLGHGTLTIENNL